MQPIQSILVEGSTMGEALQRLMSDIERTFPEGGDQWNLISVVSQVGMRPPPVLQMQGPQMVPVFMFAAVLQREASREEIGLQVLKSMGIDRDKFVEIMNHQAKYLNREACNEHVMGEDGVTCIHCGYNILTGL